MSRAITQGGGRGNPLSVALAGCRGALIGVAVFSGIGNVLMLTGSLYMMEVYDRLLPSRSIPTLIGLSVLAFLVFAFQGVFDAIRARLLARVAAALDSAAAARVFAAMLRVSRQSGARNDGMAAPRDLDAVRSFSSGPGPAALFDLTLLERDSARIIGEQAQLTAAIAQARGKIAEIELQVIQIDQDLTSDVARDMREIDAKWGELVERKVTAEDQLRRIDLRAPQDGAVHQLAVHTVGGVIGPGDAVMLIVPVVDMLAVEARAAPQDIDQLRLGQGAVLRFPAFNQRTTPEINGAVSRISADVSTDACNGQSFYTLRVSLPAAEVARLGNLHLVPGMPVEAFLRTQDRSVPSYLVKPLYDQVARAFRER